MRKRERFDDAIAKFITVETSCALNSIHDYGVVYRGIKPENILLGENSCVILLLLHIMYVNFALDRYGHIKLVDFGFAKDIRESNQTFTMCGTPEYVAPEILEGLGYGLSADW